VATRGAETAQLLGGATARLVQRLEGLTDDEYRWEPVPGCWSVRPDGNGGWAPDLAPDGSSFSQADPSPFTTLAWRLWHLGATPDLAWPPPADSGRGFVEAWFGAVARRYWNHTGVGTAAEAVQLVVANWQRFEVLFGSFSEDELDEVMGPVAGPWADATLHGLVLHVVDELIHHGAEVALLRDLYVWHPPQQSPG